MSHKLYNNPQTLCIVTAKLLEIIFPKLIEYLLCARPHSEHFAHSSIWLFNLHDSLWNRYSYYPHFKDEDIETSQILPFSANNTELWGRPRQSLSGPDPLTATSCPGSSYCQALDGPPCPARVSSLPSSSQSNRITPAFSWESWFSWILRHGGRKESQNRGQRLQWEWIPAPNTRGERGQRSEHAGWASPGTTVDPFATLSRRSWFKSKFSL